MSKARELVNIKRVKIKSHGVASLKSRPCSVNFSMQFVYRVLKMQACKAFISNLKECIC